MNPKKLRELRKNACLSQTDFAQKIGMNRSFLCQIENGEAKLPNQYMNKIAEVLNLDKDELLERLEYKEDSAISKDYLLLAIEIIDSIYDSSELSREERADLLEKVYNMVREFFAKKLSPEEMHQEFLRIKEENDKQEKLKQGFFKAIENKLTNKTK